MEASRYNFEKSSHVNGTILPDSAHNDELLQLQTIIRNPHSSLNSIEQQQQQQHDDYQTSITNHTNNKDIQKEA